MQDYLSTGVYGVGEIAKRKKRFIIFRGIPLELDTQQDWMLLNSSEENGVTRLKFNRKLNTTDQEGDVVIQVLKKKT